MAEHTFVFDKVDDLIAYMKKECEYLTPLKLQKGLYFLFAYYTQLYGKEKVDEEDCELITFDYPMFLFPAKFEAWKYGPVIREVYEKNKNDMYEDTFNEDFFADPINHEIKLFIDDMLDELMNTSDFNLVDRSHEDDVWKEAYKTGNGYGEMKMMDIKHEYQNK